MSKDFEQAYKKSAQAEAPDLWDRIEAGLNAKSVPEKKKKTLIFKRYSGVIAAAVCVAVIIPAAVLIRQSSKGYSTTDVTESIEEAESAEETGGMEEDAAELAVTGAGSNMAADNGARENMMPRPADMDAGAAGQGDASAASQEDASAADQGDVSAASQADASAEKEMIVTGESADRSVGDVFEHVQIKVVEVKENFYKEGETIPGILCTAIVQQGMSGISEGEQITIYVSSDIQASLYKDEVVEADLKYQSGDGYSYIFEKIYP